MVVEPAEIKMVIEILATTPGELADLSKHLDPAKLNLRSAEEPWSANDILAHLRACADMWGKSIQAMLAQDHPTLRYVSPRTWIRKTKYLEQEFDLSLKAFSDQRAELLAVLSELNPAGWLRGVTFAATTKRREQTVFDYAQRMAQHEQEHRIQIRQLLRTRT